MVKKNIVYRMQSGRLSWSRDKESHMKMLTAFHLGVVQRGFLLGEYHEDYIKNVDDMHFVINMDNGRTLGFHGDQAVKYADVASGGEEMTLVVRITRGRRATIKPPINIFTNQTRNYPICRLQDNIPGTHLYFLCMSCMSMLDI